MATARNEHGALNGAPAAKALTGTDRDKTKPLRRLGLDNHVARLRVANGYRHRWQVDFLRSFLARSDSRTASLHEHGHVR